jgi:uncharacterized membrane protein
LQDLIASLPPYLKYVALAMVPWIELRGAVPWAVQQGETVYMPLILIANVAVFFPTYFILEWAYEHIPEGSWLHTKLEKARAKAHPLVEKYGLLGIALFVGVPLPGTGAYAGTCAAWLLGLGWRRAFVGVAIGVAAAWGIVWALSETIAFGFRVGLS